MRAPVAPIRNFPGGIFFKAKVQNVDFAPVDHDVATDPKQRCPLKPSGN